MSRGNCLQEFAAHAGNVNCISLGRKSAGVMVTGGDDKKVNVWSIGKTQCSFSLTGHSSAVTSVTFDNSEEVVAAGALSGSIKLWDLGAGAPNVFRGLSGHRSSIAALDFMPQGSELVSGSQDTGVKVWDLRRKECVRSFKGHSSGIAHVKYSPDAKMLVSGSEDGEVRVWDLVAGKYRASLNGHTRAITGLRMHPSEYLLATSSRDKTVRLWALDAALELVDTLGPEATEIRGVMFHPTRENVITALQDGMRVWSYEPAHQLDWVDVGWHKCVDFSIANRNGADYVIGASLNQSMVGVWTVNLSHVAPFRNSNGDVGDSRDVAHCQPQPAPPRNIIAAMPRTTASAVSADRPSASSASASAVERRSSAAAASSSSSSATAAQQDARRAAVNAATALADGRRAVDTRAPRPLVSVPNPAEPTTASYAATRYGHGVRDHDEWGSPEEERPIPAIPTAHHAPHPAPSTSTGAAPARPVSANRGRSSSISSAAAPPPAPTSASKPAMVSVSVGVGDSLLRGQAPQGPMSQLPGVQAALAAAQAGGATALAQRQPGVGGLLGQQAKLGGAGPMRQSGPTTSPDNGSHQYSKWSDSDAALAAGVRGVSARQVGTSGSGLSGGTSTYDADAIADINVHAAEVRTALSRRLNALQLAKGFMLRNDVRGAIRHLARNTEPAAAADTLNVMNERNECFTLEDVPDLVRVLGGVLSLKSEQQAGIGLDILGKLLSSFGSLIRDVPLARPNGVDLASEQRAARASAARLAMQGMVNNVSLVGRLHEGLRKQAQELSLQLAGL